MKKMMFVVFLSLSWSVFSHIPTGNYKVEKIQCKSGKVMKLGGKFMAYEIFLKVAESEMTMTAKAKSHDWSPFRLNCVQINHGTFQYTHDGEFDGELPNVNVECNNEAWTNILKKRLFGVEERGLFQYKVNGKQLEIYNSNTITKYSCDAAGDYPIYFYQKID